MNRFFTGRKGSYDISRKTLYFMLVLVVLAFIFIYMAGTIQKYYGIAIENRDAVFAQIMASEAIFSPRCFAYYDESTGRLYPGFVDIDKLKAPWAETKKGCMKYADVPYSFSLQESSPSISPETGLMEGGVKYVFSSGAIEGEGEKTKRITMLVKEGIIQKETRWWDMQFQEYYIIGGQNKPRTGEQVFREVGTSVQSSLEGSQIGP